MAEKPTATPGKSGTSTTPEEMAQAEKILGGASAAPAPATPASPSKDAPAAVSATASAGHAASAPAAVKKSKLGGFSRGLGQGRFLLVEIFRSLRSPDRPTRRASAFFFVSLLALGTLSVYAIRRSMQQKHDRLEREAAQREEDAERAREAELLGKSEAPLAHPHETSMLSLGQFTLELKPRTEEGRKGGFMDMAEIELIVECDSKETKAYIEENLVQARSQMTSVFLSIDREELLSREGKRKLKRLILERLNGWIPRGKVQNAFFSKLVVA